MLSFFVFYLENGILRIKDEFYDKIQNADNSYSRSWRSHDCADDAEDANSSCELSARPAGPGSASFVRAGLANVV